MRERLKITEIKPTSLEPASGIRNFWSPNHDRRYYPPRSSYTSTSEPYGGRVQPEPNRVEVEKVEPMQVVEEPKKVSRQQQAREYMQDAISSKGVKKSRLEDTTDASLHILMALLKSGKEDLLRRVLKGGLSNYEWRAEEVSVGETWQISIRESKT